MTARDEGFGTPRPDAETLEPKTLEIYEGMDWSSLDLDDMLMSNSQVIVLDDE